MEAKKMKKWSVLIGILLVILGVSHVLAKGGVTPFGRNVAVNGADEIKVIEETMDDITGEEEIETMPEVLSEEINEIPEEMTEGTEITPEEMAEEIEEAIQTDKDHNIMLFGRELEISGAAKDLILAAGAKVTSKALGSYAFMAATQLNISGEIFKDAFAVANEVEVNGEMGRDFYAVGNEITINGTVARDIYAGGEELNITGTVNGDVNFAGGTIYVSSDAVIHGDLNLSVAEIDIRGGAQIEGTIAYTNDAIVKTLPSNVKTKVTAVAMQEENTENPFIAAMKSAAFWTVANFLLFVIAKALFPKIFETIATIYAENTGAKLGSSFGWGLLTILVMPIISILCIFTVIGSAIGIVGGFLYAIGFMVATVISGYALANTVLEKTSNPYFKGLLGIVAIEVLKQLPVIGGIVGLLVNGIAFGTIIKLIQEMNRSSRQNETE